MARGFGPIKVMPAGALGEEAVAGMHGFRPGRLAGSDDLVDDEIGFRRRRRPDMHRIIRHLDMQRVLVGVGIDRDGRDTHAAGRLDHAAGDLAPIGDEDFLEHASPAGTDRSALPLARPVKDHACRSIGGRERRPERSRMEEGP
jgi:hypothetical protein